MNNRVRTNGLSKSVKKRAGAPRALTKPSRESLECPAAHAQKLGARYKHAKGRNHDAPLSDPDFGRKNKKIGGYFDVVLRLPSSLVRVVARRAKQDALSPQVSLTRILVSDLRGWESFQKFVASRRVSK